MNRAFPVILLVSLGINFSSFPVAQIETKAEVENLYFKVATTNVLKDGTYLLVDNNTFTPLNFPLLPDEPENPSDVIMLSPRRESVMLTAYSSTYFECDGNPFRTASGTSVRDGIVATNFLPFGTKIKIPEIFGDKIFVVEDRMAKRYWKTIDIWMPSYQQALNFGVKYSEIEILN